MIHRRVGHDLPLLTRATANQPLKQGRQQSRASKVDLGRVDGADQPTNASSGSQPTRSLAMQYTTGLVDHDLFLPLVDKFDCQL